MNENMLNLKYRDNTILTKVYWEMAQNLLRTDQLDEWYFFDTLYSRKIFQ